MLERKLNNMDAPYKNIKIDVKYERKDFIKVANDMMIFGMGQINTPRLPSIERKYPIIFTGNTRSENKIDFKIPDGFEVLNLPQNIHYDTEFSSFSRTYQPDGPSIKVADIFEIKAARLPSEAYKEVREFFSNVRNSTNDTIIIKKKKDM